MRPEPKTTLKRYLDLRVPTLGLFSLLVLLLGRPTPRSVLRGSPLVLGGLLIRLIAAGTIIKDDRLTTEGIYGVVRHPLYVGNTLYGAGLCLMGSTAWFWAAFVLLSLAFHLPASLEEEGYLRRRYGSAYDEYARDVPRFLPRRLRGGCLSHVRWATLQHNYEPKGILGLLGFAVLVALKGLIRR